LNILDFAVMSTEGLRERRFRFALNLVGILIGCAAVTGLISMTQGMKTSIVDDISIFGATTIQVYPTLGGDEAFTSLGWRDLNRLRSIPGVEAAAPVQAGRYGRYDYKGNTYSNEVVGVDENYFIVHGGENEVEDGRLLARSDGSAAMLGYNVWNPDGEARYGVGDRLRIRSIVDASMREIEFTVRVVGTLKKTSGITGSGVDNYIILHLDYFEQVFDTQGKYLAVDLKAETVDDVEGIKQAIEEDFDNLGYYSMDMIMEEVNMITGTVNAVLGGIAGISLLVAGVTIANTMTVSVMERTKEIGTMKAIGATNRDVLLLFISESIVTGIMGGGLGAGLGFVLSIVIGHVIDLAPEPSMSLGLMVTGFAVATCVVSGIYPAWRASNLNPVEALRDE
jgi:putative ABC transport system permease protein